MASAGGKEVGRVSIRVVPNTDGFKRKVENDLRDLDGEKIKLRPDLDSEELERQIDRSDSDVDVKAKLKDPEKLESELRRTTQRIKESIKVDTDLNQSEFRAKVRGMIDSADGTVKVDTDVDSGDIVAKAVAARKEAQAAMGKLKAKIDVDDRGAAAKAIAWSKATSKAMTLKVKATLDSSQLKQSLNGLQHLSELAVRPFYRMYGGEIIEGIVKGFTRFKGALTIATIAASGLGVVLAPMISSTYQAGVALTKLTGAMLPSVAAAAALSYGAFFKSFQGFGNALMATNLDDFNEAIADMGPKASDAAKALYGLKGAYNSATSGAQEKFWGSVTTDLRKLTPAVELVGASVTRLSGRFGMATDEVARFFTTNQGLQLLGHTLNNATSAAGNLVSGLAKAIPGITAVGAAGSNMFAKMTDGISRTANDWSNKMVRAFESGELEKSLDKTAAGLSRFWTNVQNVGTIVGGVFAAMTREGSGLMVPLSNIVQSTADWVQSAEGVATLDGFFASIGNVISTLAPVMAEVAGTIVSDVVPAVSEMIEAAGPGLADMGNAISNALKDISPHLPAIGKGLGDILSALAPVVEKIGPAIPLLFAFAGGMKAIKAVTGVGKSISSVAKGIGKIAKHKNTGKVLRGVGNGMKFVGSHAKSGVKHVGGFAKNLGKLGPVAKFAGKGLTRLIPGVGTALMLADAGKFLVKHWEPAGRLADTVSERWNHGMSRVKDNLSKAPERIGKATDRMKEKFGNAFDGIKNQFKRTKEEWENGDLETQTGSMGLPDPGKLKERASQLKGIVSSAWAGISSAGSMAWEGLKATWSATWTSIGTVLSSAWEGIKSNASSAWAGAKELVSSAWDGLGEWWSGTWEGIKTTLSTKWESIKTGASTTWSTAKETVSNAWEGVNETWSSTWETIKTTLSEKWASIKESASSTWSTAKETVGSAWDGVQERWGGAWTTTKDTVGNLWTGIKDNATNTWSTAKETVGTAWDGVSGLWNTSWSGVSSMLGGIWGGIKSNASSTFSGVSSSVSNAWSSVSGNTSSTWNTVSSVISSAIMSAAGAVMGHTMSILSSVISMGAGIVSSVAGAMASFVGSIASGFAQAVGQAAALPGQVLGAMGNLGGLLVSSGVALVQGFINGIRSMIGQVAAAARSVVQAARDFFPFSPAKKGPFSGRGYTTYSGQALAKDFAGGMRSQIATVEKSAKDLTAAAHKPFEDNARNKILQPVLESNAEKIADSRKRERELEEEHNKRLAEIQKEGNDTAKETAEENKKYAEELADIRKDLNESLEAPDYSNIDRSFNGMYVEGMKDLLQQRLEEAVKSQGLVEKSRQGALEAVRAARATFGDHPIYAKVEANVNSDHFEYSVNKALEESGISAVPVEFVISNLDQLKDDLGMGDGVISRAIDQAAAWNWNDTDAKRYRDNKTEVHYHVEDMQEAIRLEQLRERKQMMRMV